MDLLTDPITGELDLSTGDLQLARGVDAVRQQIAYRLGLQRGTWKLDTREGVPWLQEVLVRGPDLTRIGAIFRERILSAQHVERLDSFELEFNNTTGLFRLDFVAVTRGERVAFTAAGEDLEALVSGLLLAPVGSFV